MTQSNPCTCEGHRLDRRKTWRVVARCCNNSAFYGYRTMLSEYSAVMCLVCKRLWRTRAIYVSGLPDATEAERAL